MTAADAAPTPRWAMPRTRNREPLPGDSAFMLADWGESEPVFAAKPMDAYTEERRSRLAQAMPAELLVIPAGQPQLRAPLGCITPPTEYPQIRD